MYTKTKTLPSGWETCGVIVLVSFKKSSHYELLKVWVSGGQVSFVSFLVSISSFSDESWAVLASRARLTHWTCHVWFDCARLKQRHFYHLLSFIPCLFLTCMGLKQRDLNNRYHLMVQSLNSVFNIPVFKLMKYEILDRTTRGSSNTHRTRKTGVPCLATTHVPRWQIHQERSSCLHCNLIRAKQCLNTGLYLDITMVSRQQHYLCSYILSSKALCQQRY